MRGSKPMFSKLAIPFLPNNPPRWPEVVDAVKNIIEIYASNARKHERVGEGSERIGWERFFRAWRGSPSRTSTSMIFDMATETFPIIDTVQMEVTMSGDLKARVLEAFCQKSKGDKKIFCFLYPATSPNGFPMKTVMPSRMSSRNSSMRTP